jgi:hypothetical protein
MLGLTKIVNYRLVGNVPVWAGTECCWNTIVWTVLYGGGLIIAADVASLPTAKARISFLLSRPRPPVGVLYGV